EDAGPSRDWLQFVRSPRARQKIRQHFTRERREESIEQGKEQLAHQLRRAGMPLQRLLTLQTLPAVATDFKIADVPCLYAAVGEGHISAHSVVEHIIALQGTPEDVAEESFEDHPVHRRARSKVPAETGVEVNGDPTMWVKLARCCTPVPGDEIIGFVTRGQGVSVHRKDCTNAANLLSSPERIVDVSWSSRAASSFVVAVYIEGLDRTGMLAEISSLLAEEKVSILSIRLETSKDRKFRSTITFETAETTHLEHIMKRLNTVAGVYEVHRVRS
ncbi:MAG: bifunctional (p)ppGpp synthetase/guanosine-3',5'-bis(diphosphate) 3'-pyrophosphohydrolase, partial [Actinobacteria bacterium]|nr:bifunctional (p)ppGpp synthetase/guanosine-3',5'-bis(diphosphate) 3'-pyrophosphohydrolase [Actinomycetota bacterium]